MDLLLSLSRFLCVCVSQTYLLFCWSVIMTHTPAQTALNNRTYFDRYVLCLSLLIDLWVYRFYLFIWFVFYTGALIAAHTQTNTNESISILTDIFNIHRRGSLNNSSFWQWNTADWISVRLDWVRLRNWMKFCSVKVALAIAVNILKSHLVCQMLLVYWDWTRTCTVCTWSCFPWLRWEGTRVFCPGLYIQNIYYVEYSVLNLHSLSHYMTI